MSASSLTARAVPGPRPAPLIGSRASIMQLFRDPVGHLSTLYQTYGPVVGRAHNDPQWVFAFGPEYNRLVLNDPDRFHTSAMFVPSSPASPLYRLSYGLPHMNGERHRQQRRLIAPAFQRQHVEAYRDDMVRITRQWLDRWPVDQKIDVVHEMEHLTLAIVSQTVFGLDAAREAENLVGMIHRWVLTIFSVPVMAFPFDLPGTPYRRLVRLSERLEDRVLDLIECRRAQSSHSQRDVLSLLVHARDEDGTRLTDTELIGQTNVLFGSSTGTTTSALSWTLFLLSQHPQVLADLVDELDGALHGEPPTVAQLEQLPLLERVIKESLRLLPPAIFSMRKTAAPVEIGPFVAPQDATVVCSHYITHHMPELYPEPQRFRPDRWLNISPSLHEYLPFGLGPHACIGATFAMMEIKIILSMLLQRYRLALAANARIDRQVKLALWPRYGLPMIVHRQDRRFSRVPFQGNVSQMVTID